MVTVVRDSGVAELRWPQMPPRTPARSRARAYQDMSGVSWTASQLRGHVVGGTESCVGGPNKRCFSMDRIYEVSNASFSKTPITRSGSTAQRNVARRAHPETSSTQPKIGACQSAIAISCREYQRFLKQIESVSTSLPARPLGINAALVISTMLNCVATIRAR